MKKNDSAFNNDKQKTIRFLNRNYFSSKELRYNPFEQRKINKSEILTLPVSNVK